MDASPRILQRRVLRDCRGVCCVGRVDAFYHRAVVEPPVIETFELVVDLIGPRDEDFEVNLEGERLQLERGEFVELRDDVLEDKSELGGVLRVSIDDAREVVDRGANRVSGVDVGVPEQ